MDAGLAKHNPSPPETPLRDNPGPFRDEDSPVILSRTALCRSSAYMVGQIIHRVPSVVERCHESLKCEGIWINNCDDPIERHKEIERY